MRGVNDMANYGCGTADCGCFTFREFLTKEEKISMLKEYKKALEKEAKGIEERIRELERNNWSLSFLLFCP